MILVDTSVWIDHLRRRDSDLVRLLEEDRVLMHPWILGELSLGSIADRRGFIRMLERLPPLGPAKDREIRGVVEDRRLFGRGICWVDAGLIAACLARPCRLWTRDGKLKKISGELGLSP